MKQTPHANVASGLFIRRGNRGQWPSLADRVEFSESGCWEWIGTKNAKGYGRAKTDSGVMAPIHRIFWESLVGPIPEDKQIDHLCENKACVNPDHLEPVTQRENLVRSPRTLAGRQVRQTHCLRGHEFNETNTRTNEKGHRFCRVCQRERQRNT